MYKLILIKGYTEMHFLFRDEDRLKDFMFEALDSYIPCDEDDADEKDLWSELKSVPRAATQKRHTVKTKNRITEKRGFVKCETKF